MHYFHSLMRGDALQTFNNVSNPRREKLAELLTVFRSRIHLCKKKSAYLKKSIYQAHVEKRTFEQILSYLERESELKGLEAPDELQINLVTQQTTEPNPEKPKTTSHYCKKPGHYRNQCRQFKEERDRKNTSKNTFGNNNGSNNNSAQQNRQKNANTANKRNDRKPKTVYPPCVTSGKTNHSTEKCYFGANAANRQPPRIGRPMERSQNQQQDKQISTIKSVQTAVQAL